MTRRFIPSFLVAILLCAFGLVFVDAEVSNETKAQLEQAFKDEKWDVIKEMVQNRPEMVECEFRDKRTLLHIAAAAGREDVVKLLLEYGAEVDAWDRQRRTPLFDAVERGSREVIALLVKNGADLNAHNYMQKSVLYSVIKNGDIKMVRFLIEQGMDVTRFMCLSEHPLDYAILGNHPDIVDLLVANGVDLDTKVGEYALRLAVAQRDPKMVRRLLDRGAVINRPGCANAGILHYALEKENGLEMIALLVDRGADVNAIMPGGTETVLTCAVKKKAYAMAELLLKNGAKANLRGALHVMSLYQAVANDDAKMVKLLLAHGADPCLKMYEGYSSWILMVAIGCSTTEVASMLIKAGADLNACDSRGYFPLKTAIKKKRLDMVKLLLDSGAAINTVDKHGRNALDFAIKCGYGDSEKLLRAAGAKPSSDPGYSDADVETAFAVVKARDYDKTVALLKAKPALLNCRNERLQNLLHCATSCKAHEMVELLLARKININARDTQDRTPLYYAAEHYGYERIMALLLGKGANPNARACDGRVPLHVALRNREKVAMLLKAGAKADVADMRGQTPLHEVGSAGTARKYGMDVAWMLIENGADIHAKDLYGLTHLDLLLRNYPLYVNLVEYYLAEGVRPSDALMDAVVRDDETAVKELLAEDPERKTYKRHQKYYKVAAYLHRVKATRAMLENGVQFEHHKGQRFYESPLTYAVLADCVEIVALFVAHGADPKLPGNASSTLIFYARSAEMARLLMGFGLSIKQVNEHGQTPIHYAVDQNDGAMIKFCIEQGLDIKRRDYKGETLLHYAIRTMDRTWVRYFIDHGIDVNVRDNGGGTPLHTVTTTDDLSMARYLIVKGADVNARNKAGQTPLYRLAEMGRLEMAELLIANGADVKAKTNDGVSILQIAERYRHMEIVALLKKHGAK